MHGDQKVIARLNALSSELTAIVQYMTQSEMCQNWGYKRLGKRTKARAMEEMQHAEGLIERIIFFAHDSGRRAARGFLGGSASFHQGNGNCQLPRATIER